MMSDLNMSHEKIVDFVLFPLFGFTLVIKLKNYDFESHWNTLISKFYEFWKISNYFNQKVMPNLIMSSKTVSDLVYASLFE